MRHHLCFTDESEVDYRICRALSCPQTPPGGMVRRLFRYCFSLKYKGDINFIAESVFLGERKRLDGERMDLKVFS